MIRLACLASLAVLALAACQKPDEPASAPQAFDTAAPTVVTPTTPVADPNQLTAEGLGPIRIGMTVAEVEATAGAPATPIANPADCNIFHPANAPAGIYVMTEMGQVSRITVKDTATVKADEGFGIGSPATAIKAAYGGGIIAQPAKYDPAPSEDLYLWARGGSTAYVTDPAARGLRFEVGTDGKVKAIQAGGPSIQLAESCG